MTNAEVWSNVKRGKCIPYKHQTLSKLKEILENEPVSVFPDNWKTMLNPGPCDYCRFSPPSSGDGKPCTMCPAEKRVYDAE